MSQELTYAEVAAHSSKKDLYVVIHDKVYNTSSFVDEHPARSSSSMTVLITTSGGEEVLLDVGGQDATEAFEDVGHSDEAREILQGLLVGNLKRAEGDPAPKITTTTTKPVAVNQSSGMGISLYVIILLGGAAAFGAYKYLQSQEGKA